MSKNSPPPICFDMLPGHYMRRLQQIAVAIFLQETQAFGITPIQYATMGALAKKPNMDQKTLAKTIGLDASTIGGVIDRLQSRDLVQRNPSHHDRRVHLLTLTPPGQALFDEASPVVIAAQSRILAPLPESQHAQFMQMLQTLVSGNNELSRAPTR